MAGGVSIVHWSGLASCVLGGVFYLIAWAKGIEARQLEKAKRVEKLSDLAKYADLFPMVVAVVGRVWTDKPLKCELSDSEAVIAQIVEEQHSLRQFAGGDWVKDVQTVRSSVRECPWALEDSGVRVPVLEGRNATEDDLLDLAGDIFTEANTSMSSRIFNHFLGWAVVGTRRIERVLPVGAPVTAVGEAATVSEAGENLKGLMHHKGHVIVIRAPQQSGGPFLMSKRSLSEVISSLDDVSKMCRYAALGFGAMGVALITWRLARQAVIHWRQHKIRVRVQKAAARLAAAGLLEDQSTSEEEGGRPADLCVVCLERRTEAVFTSCGHLCACMSCADKLTQCPICRATTKHIQVYRT